MTSSDGHYQYVGDDPARIELAGSELGNVGHTFATLAGEVEHDTVSIGERWPKGHTGQLAAADAARMGTALDECRQVFAKADQALSVLYPVLVANRRQVDDLNRAYLLLANTEDPMPFMTARFGNPLLTDWPQMLRGLRAQARFDSLAEIDRAYARVQQQVSEETTICNDLLDRLAQQASGMPGHAGGGKSRYDMSFNLLFEANQFTDLLSSRVWSSADPKKVHDAWVLLTKDMQEELLLADPLRFGNLNGIPAADRDTANQAMLTARLDLLKRACLIVGVAYPGAPEDLDRMSPAALLRVEQTTGLSARALRQAINLRAQLNLVKEGDAQLLAYEPAAYGGKGRAAIAFGTVDSADNVVFCVPGLLSSLDNVQNVAKDALHLYRQAGSADPFLSTAVVAWQGYDAPDVFNVAFQGSAEQGAKNLARDVNAMRITHGGVIGELTVVGHSYGSTTTGLALQREHLVVDQAVLIGSPGMGGDARTVADLNLKPGQLFVGSASRDLATVVPRFMGTDPARDSVGGIRFGTESPDRGWGYNKDDHSLYFDDSNDNESLHALADIATGHGDRLGEEGLMVASRDTGLIPTLAPLLLGGVAGSLLYPNGAGDPEFDRTPTIHPDHAPDAGLPHP
jgi:pimeloyl-ACP methyl ester carboxylesterase